MRLHLMGSVRPPEPLVLALISSAPFLKAQYIDAGYTHYDIMCIGGAGGNGGRIGTTSPGYGNKLVSGGGGGGGGSQLLTAMDLLALPTSVTVLVGAAGVNGTDTTIPANGGAVTAGTNGQESSFNGTTCRASGGKGGLVPTISAGPTYTTGTPGIGGAGGAGGTTSAGNGAASATEGTWASGIGKGGGGGVGGGILWTGSVPYQNPTSGKRGAWDVNQPELSGSADLVPTPANGMNKLLAVAPTGGGGASGYPINGRGLMWGCNGPASSTRFREGAVLLRLYTPEA